MGVPIPKKGGGERVLGVPTVADRVAQTAVKKVLEPELEKVFLPDSYGYRPNKSAHDAIGVTRQRCWKYDWLVEFDIRGLFDNISWDKLMDLVKLHTHSEWVLLYMARWLQAPIKTKTGKIIERTMGTLQGGVISTVLSNVFLHYCFDIWMTENYPTLPWCRYADDGLFHCKTLLQAEHVLSKVKERFREWGLELHPDKTKVVCCKTNDDNNYPTKSFDFLGYTFRRRKAYNRSAKQSFTTFTPAIIKKALKSMRYRIKHEWKLKGKPQYSLEDISREINPVIRGWIHYYGKYNGAELAPLYSAINLSIIVWGKRKFKNLRQYRGKPFKWLRRICKTNPELLYNWKIMAVY